MNEKPQGKITLPDLQADALKHESLFQSGNFVESDDDRQRIIQLNQDIYERLPWILNTGCKKLTDPIEKEVFLISALGVISGLLPNVQGFYDTKYYGPNLYTYILGKYGSGKGSIQMAKMLGTKIHSTRLQEYAVALKEYNIELQQYKKDLKAFHNDKRNILAQPEEPSHPPQTMLYIPVNNSKSGMFQLLDENKGRGILFETEGDTLVDAIKQDYGNYSDGLRKAFHHEEISFYRRTGKEFHEIAHPELSLILSSTFDQFQNLVPDIHNGLFSRFCYYILPPSKYFKNVFNNDKRDYPVFFIGLGNQMAELHDLLNSLDEPVQFQLSPDQRPAFLSLFQGWKDEFAEFVSDDLDGTVNRLGLIFFRLAMILSTLRSYKEDRLLREIICSDLDFSLAMSLTDTFKQVSLRLFYWFPVPESPIQDNDFFKKAKQKNEAVTLRSSGMSYRNISKQLDIPKSTIFRWLND